MERQSLYNAMVRDHGYRQLIDNPTTDDYTLIDHIHTNIVNVETVSGNSETYFSDHKAIYRCHAKKDRPTANELGTASEEQLSHFYRMKQG